jgi:hypothetical protein
MGAELLGDRVGDGGQRAPLVRNAHRRSVAATRCDHAPSAWPSTAEGVDDPSGNQRGAAGEGEPGSFRERRDDPADLLLQGDSARHHDAAPRLEPSRPPAVDVVRQHKFWHKSTSSASTT